MRKTIIILLLLISFRGISQELIDTYNESNSTSNLSVYSGSSEYAGNSFTNVTTHVLTSAKFQLSKSGSPTGNVYANIFAHSGTYGTSSVGTGSALATSNPIDITTISTSATVYEFTFSGANQITLAASTYYVVVVRFSGGDVSNRLNLRYDNTGEHSGNFVRATGALTWTAGAAQDAPFYVYGTAVSGVSPFFNIAY